MKYSTQFSDAIHIMVYIEIYKNTDLLSSNMIASSIETNPANVRKIMSSLKKNNLITTQVGKPNPKLARKPEDITLLDIYKSIEGNTALIQVDANTNTNCIVGANIQDVLADNYAILQKSVEDEMSNISLAEILTDISTSEVQKRPQNEKIVKEFLE